MGKGVPFFFFLCLLLLASCDKTRVYDEYQSLPNEWHKDSVVTFKVAVPDTLEKYNLFINVRNNSDYKYSNLFVITKINFPFGKVVSDTLQYEMAKPSGEWLGSGFGEVKESKLWYKENFQFSEAGEYSVTIQQAMRKRDSTKGIERLFGVTEVGFRIEKTNN